MGDFMASMANVPGVGVAQKITDAVPLINVMILKLRTNSIFFGVTTYLEEGEDCHERGHRCM